MISDVGRIVILLVIAGGLVIGLVTGTWESDGSIPAWTALGTIIGYLTGARVAITTRKEDQ